MHINSQNISFTALAVNRDGVFAAVKEKYEDDNNIPRYRLKVEKYAKTGRPTAPDSEIPLVDNAPQLTTTLDAPLSGEPSDGTTYNRIDETIDGLQVVDGALYAVTSRITKTMKEKNSIYVPNAFRSDGTLYRVGKTDTFSGKAQQLDEKKAVGTEGAEAGYGFYRFIAVKPKKLVIASDGGWGTGSVTGPPTTTKNTDKVLEYDLEGHLQNGENGKKAGGSFSKELKKLPNNSGFGWN